MNYYLIFSILHVTLKKNKKKTNKQTNETKKQETNKTKKQETNKQTNKKQLKIYKCNLEH